MAKMMMIETEEGLMTWCKSTDSAVRLQRRGAKIILDYLSGHGRMLSTNPEGELFINDENVTEKTTLDDVVDLVCEWNYEELSDTRERKDNPDDFLDYCRCCTLEKTLEEHKFILDRIFKQTVYGRDVQTIAHKLALEMMKEMKLVPIYDIPMADEIGAYSKVSERSEYQTESNDKNEMSGDTDIEADKEKIPAEDTEQDKDDVLTEGNEPNMDAALTDSNEPVKDIPSEIADRSTGATEKEPETDNKEHTKVSDEPEEVKASDKEEDKREQGRSR